MTGRPRKHPGKHQRAVAGLRELTAHYHVQAQQLGDHPAGIAAQHAQRVLGEAVAAVETANRLAGSYYTHNRRARDEGLAPRSRTSTSTGGSMR